MRTLSIKPRRLRDRVLYFSMLLFPMPILRFGSILAGTILMALYVILSFARRGKLYGDRISAVALLLSIATLLSAVMSSMGDSWKIHAFSQFGQFVLLILFFSIARKTFREEELGVAVSGLRDSCKANLVLCFVQAVSWYAFRVDFNDRVFNQLLHLQADASKMRFGHVSVSGFGWHPAQLIPVLITSYFFFDSLPMKIVVVVVGLLTGNFSCALTVLLCAAFSIFNALQKKHNKEKLRIRDAIIRAVVLVSIIVAVVVSADIIEGAISNTVFNFSRIQYALSGNYESGSTMKHSRYYLGYFQVAASSSVFQNLFGYGIDCSGYPYSKVFFQYMEKASWHVESDIINIIVGRGWIWTILFYLFLIKNIAVKGYRISIKYAYAVIVLMIVGVFYDCQGRWTMYWEALMFIGISRGIDIWSNEKTADEMNRDSILDHEESSSPATGL